jgi:DNA-binding SARP family transcriptional activator/TolB-like protein
MADQAVRPPAESRAGKSFQFRLWGCFQATRLADGADVTPRGRKSRALLAYLLLDKRANDRERLAGLLWSERGEAQARASLRQCLLELRDFCDDGAPLLRSDRQQVAIDPGRAQLDLDEMLRLTQADEADALAEALAGGGTLLEGLDGIDPAFDDWLRAVRAERVDALLAAAQRCARRALDAGHTDAACRLTQALQAMDPLDETLAGLAMEVGDRLGRQDYVQRVYDKLADDLARELGVGPSAETRALHERLLNDAGDRPASRPPDEPVVPLPPIPSRAQARPARPARKRRLWLYALAALLLAAGLALTWLQLRQTAPAEPASLAVLPFRNLSAGDDYFAEGVAEEILAQLSREPELRVAGRTSSWTFRDNADVIEIGRRLDVNYVLEGSVRTVADRVRVNVALVRTDDSTRLWGRTFNGRLDDIFRIQDDIGSAVAASLKRKLVYAGTPSATLRTSGEVYGMYLTARGLIRTRDTRNARAAVELLDRAVKLDPDYAPALSSLAQAMRLAVNDRPGAWGEDDDAKAIGYVRRALRLAPNFAAAHGTLGMLLGFETPEAAVSIRRAAALDPNNAELQFWLGNVHANSLDYKAALAAYRRANELDPLLNSAGWELVFIAVDMNRPDIARAAIERIERAGGRFLATLLKAHAAIFLNGDFSAAMRWAVAAGSIGDPNRNDWADYYIASIKRRLGEAAARSDWDDSDEATRRLVEGGMPAIEELRSRLAKPPVMGTDITYTSLGLKRLLNAGRGSEVADLHDSDYGLLGLSSKSRPSMPSQLVSNAALVAMVLRDVGRHAEADRLLARADRAIRTARAQGPVPGELLGYAAQVWAVQGRPALALAALERATIRGWIDQDEELLLDIGDEPAFRSLRNDPRFEAIRARINAHRERERREVERLKI